jgi:sec-independent protein translocase protein TatA
MQDWMIVVVIGIVVIFGASKLPQIARNMGKAQGEFKKGLREGVPESDQPPAATQAPPSTSTPPTGETPTSTQAPPATSTPVEPRPADTAPTPQDPPRSES